MLVRRGLFSPELTPNHCLINFYEPGQGIMSHTDGPMYQSRVATISLGSFAIMNFTPRLLSHEIEPGKR